MSDMTSEHLVKQIGRTDGMARVSIVKCDDGRFRFVSEEKYDDDYEHEGVIYLHSFWVVTGESGYYSSAGLAEKDACVEVVWLRNQIATEAPPDDD